MKKYSTYKDSGVEWIGEIPEHWDRVRLKTIVFKKITDGPHETPVWVDMGIPFISAEAIKGNKIDLNFKRGFISKEQHLEYCKKSKVKKDDILFCKSGSTTGKSALVTTEEDFGIWSPLAIIRTDEKKADYNFVFQSIQANYFRLQVETSWTFGTQPNIGMNSLENLWITKPPLEEQAQIANYLNQKTQQIDDLIAKKERLIELLEEERTALINQTVTKGLDPNVPIKDSGVDWLGMIPMDWGTKKLRFLALIIPSNIDKKSKEGEKRVQLCNYTDVYKNDFISYDENFMWASASDTQIQKLTLKANDVIVTKDSEDPSDIGVPALVLEDMNNVVCGYHLTVFRENQNNGFGRYLYWFLKSTYCSDYFNLKARGITRYALGTNAFKELHVPTPKNLSEYGKIADFLEHKTSGIAEAILKIEQEIELVKEYKTTLISEVVTGKIDVREEILIEQL